MSASSVPRPWWCRPGPALALLLHAVLFLGIFQLHFRDGEWRRIANSIPSGARIGAGVEAIVRERGPLGLVIWFFDMHGEIRLYHRYASVALYGIDPRWPADAPDQGRLRLYHDIPVEYQPGALLVLLPPGLLGRDFDAYRTGFVAWCGVLYLSTLLLGLHLLADGRPITTAQANRALWGSVAFLLCFGGLAGARFDHVVPLFCVVGGILFQRAMRTDRLVWFIAFGALTAAGALVKIVPVVLVPAALLWLIAAAPRPPWRAAGAVVAGFGVTLLALHFAFYTIWGDGYLRSFTYHMERGIQIESVYAGVIMAGHGLGQPMSVAESHAAYNLETPYAGLVKSLHGLLFLAVAGAIAGRFLARRRSVHPAARDLAVLLLSAVFLLAFVATNKVFSPQYLLWLGPLLALAYGFQPRLAPGVVALLVISLLTQAIFPRFYKQLRELQPALIVLLNLRNVILIALLAWLGWTLARQLGEESDPSKAASWMTRA
jgi:4-amino-4-deoxy-L-arabinose transferase-like glycosyltransferase